MLETLGMLPFGNLLHSDKMLQNLKSCFLRPIQESWSRSGPGRWRERRISVLWNSHPSAPLGQAQPPWDRHSPVSKVALENSRRCSQLGLPQIHSVPLHFPELGAETSLTWLFVS